MAFPTRLVSATAGTQIGGLWLEKNAGFIVETVATNGAQNTLWNKWDSAQFQHDLQVSKPDIITLAYGTNEAFNPNLTVSDFRHDFHERIRWLKQTQPQALIIVIGAPEAYRMPRAEDGSDEMPLGCELRPALLDGIQRAQMQIAKQENVVFWDWQASMGGRCQVEQLIQAGLMQKDGVHLTRRGYELSAERFADFLLSVLARQH